MADIDAAPTTAAPMPTTPNTAQPGIFMIAYFTNHVYHLDYNTSKLVLVFFIFYHTIH